MLSEVEKQGKVKVQIKDQNGLWPILCELWLAKSIMNPGLKTWEGMASLFLSPFLPHGSLYKIVVKQNVWLDPMM